MSKAAGRAEKTGFILGIDGGVASVGWSLIQTDSQGVPVDIVGLGVRIFDSGTDGGGTKRGEEGRDEPRNLERRRARQMRRQIWRRARRRRKLLRALIRYGLLPEPKGPLDSPAAIHHYLEEEVDRPVRKLVPATGHRDRQTYYYKLRALAAVEPVGPLILGRVLYQLGQRRGFKSNRRTDGRATPTDADDKSKKKAEEERSEFFGAIAALQHQINAFDPPTLGAFLASLNPDEARIRGRRTNRAMFESEFDRIWTRQSQVLRLSEEARREIRDAIFEQRPLKSVKSSVGRCSLIASERRAPLSHRLAQRFRVLQLVNDVQVAEFAGLPRDLPPDKRQILLGRLLVGGDLGKKEAKALLGYLQNAKFNFDEGPSKHFVGHRTDAKLRAVLGDLFGTMSDTQLSRLVREIESERPDEELAQELSRAIKDGGAWGFSEDVARALAALCFEPGTASFSLRAIQRLLPHLEAGDCLSDAIGKEFPESKSAGPVFETLPPILAFAAAVRGDTGGFPESLLETCRQVPSDVLARLASLNTPAVIRTLTEMRTIVNAVLRRYGLPDEIRIELARELKKSKAARRQATEAIRRQTQLRETHAANVLSSEGRDASRVDVLKSMLWKECGGQCPYTGKMIPFGALFSATGDVEIEHIWPRSRSLDNSFRNLTLCYADANARKSGKTPYEAFGATPQWPEIIARVRAFTGDRFTVAEKLRRFEATDPPLGEGEDQYRARELNDTRYASRLAADYLGLLYGGRVDADGRRRVQVRSGGLTAALRRGWGLDDTLSDDGTKNREDHRHHAVDALVIGLSDNRQVKELSEAAARAERRRRKQPFSDLQEPWVGFRQRVEETVNEIAVSHRQGHRVRGKLHDDNSYAKAGDGTTTKRTAIGDLSLSEIRSDSAVKDARVRSRVRALLAQNGLDPNKKGDERAIKALLSSAQVKLPGHGGAEVRVRRVTVRTSETLQRIGTAAPRWVKTGGNHHAIVYAIRKQDGKPVWQIEVISTLEVARRLAAQKKHFSQQVRALVADGADRRRIFHSPASLDMRLTALRDAARQAAVAAHPVVNRARPAGEEFLFSFGIDDYFRMRDPKDNTRFKLWRVLSISSTESGTKIKVIEASNNDPAAVSGAARTHIGSGERLRELEATKVDISPLGEIRPAGG